MKPRIICAYLFLFAASVVCFASPGVDTPAWLVQAAAIKVPAYEKDVPAVVLVDDRRKTIDSDGRVTQTYNFALRILRREGRDYAVGSAGYIPDSGKIKEFHAWLVRPNGETKRYANGDVLDLAADPNDVYNEYRLKQLSARSDADTGMVFGYTYSSEERTVFSQDDRAFQGSIPVLSSRYTLVLPQGWRADSMTFNHAKVEPIVNGSTYTWELTGLPPIPDEPMSPSLSNLVARVAVSYYPPAPGQSAAIKTFANWADVAAWMAELEDPQVVVDDALGRKANELTALAKNEMQKMRAIADFVQKIRYISIQTGLGRGGGYKPHPSNEVFAKAYGDCKDKATLMRAMLKAVGIVSYPVSIFSGDPEYVRSEWPSPQQFNHCIIAVKINDDTVASTVIKHPALGRLLIFDPTDEETPLGDLPFYLQGSLALIDSKDSTDLVQMPITPADMNRLQRTAALKLGADGAIAGSIEEQAEGQVAARFRLEFRHLSPPEYNAMIERWVTSGAAAARLGKIEPHDNAAEGRFTLDVAFTANGYAQLMQDRLLVFKPAVVSRRDALALTATDRKHPVVLRANAYSETVTVELPGGFVVDEVPDPVKIDTPFGSYATSYEVKNNELVFKRQLSQRAATVPANQYESVRKFFERIRTAEQSPVVLARK